MLKCYPDPDYGESLANRYSKLVRLSRQIDLLLKEAEQMFGAFK